MRLWFLITTRASSLRAFSREILPLAYERVPVLIDPKIRNFSHLSSGDAGHAKSS